MYTGTGDANTDVGAHLMGFVSGFAGGMILTNVIDRLSSVRLQLASGALALGLLIAAWTAALASSNPPPIM